MSRGVTLIIPETDARRLSEWTPCQEIKLTELKDGTVKLETRGLRPAPAQCDWCSGKGFVTQVGPQFQEAKLPCSNCDGRGVLA